MKRVLFIDRLYSYLNISTDKFEPIYVALNTNGKKLVNKYGNQVVACFEEEYDSIVPALVPDNYLIHSFAMDRFLKNRFTNEKRMEILGKEIAFWGNVLDQYKPDIIYNEVCTMEWVEVLYIESQKRKIPFVTFLAGSKLGKIYHLETPFNSALDSKRWDNADPSKENFEQASIFVNATRNKQQKPFYVQGLKDNKLQAFFQAVNYCIDAKYRRIVHGKSFFYEDYYDYSRLNLTRTWLSLFRKLDGVKDIKGREYLFYPLHFEPEATISYFCEFNSDQASLIGNISRCLKTNQLLVVKEHPQQRGMLLTRKFQEVKKANANIIYLPGDISSIDVINDCKAIVTITGTAGYEGMMIGKPVFTLGNVFYNACTEVTHINNISELKQIIRQDRYKYPNIERVIEFVAKFMSLQVDGAPYIINGEIDKTGLLKLENTIFNLLENIYE